MKGNLQKRLKILPGRHASGSKREESRPRDRPAWMRDRDLDRSINAAVQDGDYTRERER
jgi:hypothetical protein